MRSNDAEGGPLKCAAQYLRMSTEHQRYSLDNQADAIALFAAAHGYQVTGTYVDAGKSGLTVRDRDGLRKLLADVLAKQSSIEAVLVYDISRWGRFQDPDQGAHYEFLCREAGVPVHYCAEPFENDGSLGAVVLKSLKRAMAAEYSRELGEKVRASKRRAAAEGYWMGGAPTYGLRRALIDEHGVALGELGHNQRKAVQSHRTVIQLGPPDEIETVRTIFGWYVDERLSRPAIAARLNTLAIPTPNSRVWSTAMVRAILTNEAFAGDLVQGRYAQRLGAGQVRTPPDAWIRRAGVVPPTISRERFQAAQRLCRMRATRGDRLEMILGLRRLLDETGRLSARLIDADSRIPSYQSYDKEFGGLRAAYAEVGWVQRNIVRCPTLGPYHARIAELVVLQRSDRPEGSINIRRIWRTLQSEGLGARYGAVWAHVSVWHGKGMRRSGALYAKDRKTPVTPSPPRPN